MYIYIYIYICNIRYTHFLFFNGARLPFSTCQVCQMQASRALELGSLQATYRQPQVRTVLASGTPAAAGRRLREPNSIGSGVAEAAVVGLVEEEESE